MNELTFYDKKKRKHFKAYYATGSYNCSIIVYLVVSLFEENGILIGSTALQQEYDEYSDYPNYDNQRQLMSDIRDCIRTIFTGKDVMTRYRENRDKTWAETRLNIYGRKILYTRNVGRRGTVRAKRR